MAPPMPTIGRNAYPPHHYGLSTFWPENPLWHEHAPFASWLIEALRPRTLVELGTHAGFSYFTFCQAVRRLALPTNCYAIDTWKGDVHTGWYDEDIYNSVQEYNNANFSNFSTLIRSTFDHALPDFKDGSIDLLHIDGRHFYKDVKHDFETCVRNCQIALSCSSMIPTFMIRILVYSNCGTNCALPDLHLRFCTGTAWASSGLNNTFQPPWTRCSNQPSPKGS